MTMVELQLRRRRLRRVVLVVIAVFSFALLYAFWPRPRVLETGRVSRGDLRVEVVDEGRTRMRELYVISAPAPGRVLRIDVESGDMVRRGQIVARIVRAAAGPLNARELAATRASVVAAAANLRAVEAESVLARRDFERVQRLFDARLVSEAQRDAARVRMESLSATRQAAAAERDRVRSALRVDELASEAEPIELLPVRAPVDGRVLSVSQESEGVVAAGASLVTLGDPTIVEVVAQFLSQDAVRMQRGASAVIEAWGGSPLAAVVERIEPVAHTKVSALGIEEQRANVVLTFVAPPPTILRTHDYRVDARVLLESRSATPHVPQAALFRAQEGWRVFRVVDGRAREVPVTVGLGDGKAREVLSGLTVGDEVVLFPRPDLRDGQRVKGL